MNGWAGNHQSNIHICTHTHTHSYAYTNWMKQYNQLKFSSFHFHFHFHLTLSLNILFYIYEAGWLWLAGWLPDDDDAGGDNVQDTRLTSKIVNGGTKTMQK